MDMESVISAQHITHRRKPPRTAQPSGLFAHDSLLRAAATARSANPTRRDAAARVPQAAKLLEEIQLWTEPLDTPVAASTPAARGPRRAPKPKAVRGDHGRLKPLVYAGAIAAFFLSALTLAASAEAKPSPSDISLPEDVQVSSLLLYSIAPPHESVPNDTDSSLSLPRLPVTLDVTNYTIQKNDTIDGIARRFGVRMDTLISLNALGDARRIRAGAILKIPNMDGVVHTVAKGESLSGIAQARGVPVMDIIDANDMVSQIIQPGQRLFLPGVRLPSTELKRALGTLVTWPVRGSISSYYGYRPNPFTGVRQWHSGIDIVAPVNSPAKAAMDGRVSETGYSTIFGNYVILTHADGYQTLYAHLNKISVKRGARVNQGASVGLIGSTGYSTGVHLHFGVFKNGAAINPLKVLGS